MSCFVKSASRLFAVPDRIAVSRKRVSGLFAAAALSLAASQAQPVGFQRISLPMDMNGPALQGAAWYPCNAPEVEITVYRSVIAGTPDCPMPAGPMTLVVMSHGSGGSFLGHHDTARALAEAGFVVAALNHTGDNALDRSRQGYLSIFSTRPREIRRLIDFMTGAWPGRAQLRSDAVGFFGFSRGGYTGLVLAGAAPDFSQGLSFCESQPGLPMCRDIAAGKAPVQPYPKDVRVKALVIADPLNAFAPSALAGVAAPVQLWASGQGGDGVTPASVEALRQGLPAGTDFRRVAGAGHFAFMAPCSQAQADALPSLCTDGPGFDRAVFHRDFNAGVVAFMRQTLR
ncbi:dienelactone hydrolase [Achromobacter xylosoxidans]